MHALSVRTVDEQIDRLPSIGEIEHQIIQLLESDADFGKISDLVLKDPVLTTRILGLANSPFYGVRGTVTSVNMACAILGVKTLHSYILSLAFFGGIESRLSKAIVAHSFQVAMLSQFISKKIGFRDDSVFIVGLLHDIGKIYIAEYYPKIASQLFTDTSLSEHELVQLESGHLGFNHLQIGVLIARHWDLPEKIIDAINNQMTMTQDMNTINKVLTLADFIANDVARHDSAKTVLKHIPRTMLTNLDVDRRELKNWHTDIIDVIQQAAQMAADVCQ